jgi:hypothetical protein
LAEAAEWAEVGECLPLPVIACAVSLGLGNDCHRTRDKNVSSVARVLDFLALAEQIQVEGGIEPRLNHRHHFSGSGAPGGGLGRRGCRLRGHRHGFGRRGPERAAQHYQRQRAQHCQGDNLLPIFDSQFHSGSRSQITVHGNLQLDRSRAFARQVHAIHRKEKLRSFQRIDEPHQLQVVPGKTAIDFDWNYAGALGVLFLVVLAC